MKKIIIAAVSENGVIGKDGNLPWKIPEELKFFKEQTYGSPVLTGRKTFETIGKVLEGRLNVVISKTKKFSGGNLISFNDIQSAFDYLEKNKFEKVFIIGGETVFRQTIEECDGIILSKIKGDYDGDKFFPMEKLKNLEPVKKVSYEKFEVYYYEKI